jgi:hypothetical protein
MKAFSYKATIEGAMPAKMVETDPLIVEQVNRFIDNIVGQADLRKALDVTEAEASFRDE